MLGRVIYMQNKQIYIADTNHETILISTIEKEVISTKVFNRLHYISQNSTAYLTFPSNRTKRFEHSIGTMFLCGEIFFNAICNAEDDVIEELFESTKKIILDKIVEEQILHDADKYKSILGDDNFRKYGERLKDFSDYVLNSKFYNQYIPGNILEKQKMLYLIVFQSIRLAGLLHDIGHPPFSHITESAMNKIYKDLQERKTKNISLNNAETGFLCVLEKYDENDTGDFQLHEKMGLKMVERLFRQNLFSGNSSGKIPPFKEQYFKTIVFHLVELILREESGLKKFHNIVAGTIDGDRLDYVNRDIDNSGIDNGRIEYDRLISSCQFVRVNVNGKNDITIAYSVKTINTIENFFMKRWYLYKNIINHHRVSKTDALLQKCIESVIQVRLEKEEEEEGEKNILPYDISGLWKAIENSYSHAEYFDFLIQWDDNWLMTILKKHYFMEHFGENTKIAYMLEELLSNKKNYYSLIKTIDDFSLLADNFEKGIDFSVVEKEVMFNEIDKRTSKGQKNRTIRIVLAYLDSVLDTKFDVEKYINDFVDQSYKKIILGTLVVSKKLKTGLDSEPIVYNNAGEQFELSSISNIKSILEMERSGYPLFYIYVKTEERKGTFSKENFLKELGTYLGKEAQGLLSKV